MQLICEKKQKSWRFQSPLNNVWLKVGDSEILHKILWNSYEMLVVMVEYF